jgi:hypothetical protein
VMPVAAASLASSPPGSSLVAARTGLLHRLCAIALLLAAGPAAAWGPAVSPVKPVTAAAGTAPSCIAPAAVLAAACSPMPWLQPCSICLDVEGLTAAPIVSTLADTGQAEPA